MNPCALQNTVQKEGDPAAECSPHTSPPSPLYVLREELRKPESVEAEHGPAEEAGGEAGGEEGNRWGFAWPLPAHKLLPSLISLTAAVEFHGQLVLSTNRDVMSRRMQVKAVRI